MKGDTIMYDYKIGIIDEDIADIEYIERVLRMSKSIFGDIHCLQK